MKLLRRLTYLPLIIIELTAIALVVAMVLNLLPLNPGQVLWLAGVVVAIGTALTLGSARPGRAALYGALVVGAAVFMLPFLWLLSTSFKQPEETFVFPPRWLPATAAAPRESPWHDKEELRVCLGDVRIRYTNGDENTIKVEWKAQSPTARLSPSADGAIVGYGFVGADASTPARIAATLEVLADSAVESVTLRMRQDVSWHRLHAKIEYAGQVFGDNDSLYLGVRQWRELTFDLRPSSLDQRALGIWPTSQIGTSNIGPGKMLLSVEIVPLSKASATIAKWTQSYRDAWYADPNWPLYIGNSVILVVMNVIGQILACSMAAFALSRLRWPGRELAFGIVLSTMMLPAMILLVPQFLIFRKLGWYDTLLPLWVPAFAGTPFFIFMLRQFMLAVPKDLEEAARIDGCSWWGIYWRVMLPLMRPALAAVAIFTFMGTWNEFMKPLIYLSDARLYPLPLGLYNFSVKNATFFNMLMAASSLMTLPAVALFLGAQRYFIEGVTLTGMKG
jgi:multiple sugar transport system permease protein